MSFYANNNRIYVTNTAGSIVFDTDRQMPAITSVVNGAFSIPARGPGVGQTVAYHDIGSASGSPEFVLGVASITGGSSYPWVNTMFNCSGSVLTNLGWNYTDSWRLAGARAISFEVLNGRLYIREEYYNQFPTLNLATFTLNYKVYMGRYL